MNHNTKRLFEHASKTQSVYDVVEDATIIEFTKLIIEEIQSLITQTYHETPLECCGYLIGLDEKIAQHFLGDVNES